MDQTLVLNLLICTVAFPYACGFICYTCSYTTETEGSRRDCIENPSALGSSSHFECNSTSYCVLQEQYDIHRDLVTSYFRTCSGVSWGNECKKDWSHVSCKASCQGNYCNEGDVGKRYEAYLASHRDSDYLNNASFLNMNICILMSVKFLHLFIL